ncbi:MULTISPECIES: ATP-dependent nuclease [Sphingobacterium]|uniref:ATP-dependent nuclease n=1 Tax=Sphingobacterium TaxID=28453 RepID=UPI002579E0C8|nr:MULTISPECIES: AAA family ATPase [Sphingobacterium]
MIKSLSITGLRGFAKEGQLNISIPNGKPGSGLTTLVGPNNSGKSTIIEALTALNISRNHLPSFPEGKRNRNTDYKICLKLVFENDDEFIIKSSEQGGSETEKHFSGHGNIDLSVFVIKSRRTFNPYFGQLKHDRNMFLTSFGLEPQRTANYDHFSYRLFKIHENPTLFNEILAKVINPLPIWTIEQSDQGQYYIKFISEGDTHSSEGTGEGILSVFTIVDAIYDSGDNDVIVIDEPELSLHPSLQRNLLDLLLEVSKTKQIIISTHSRYFISWDSLINGGNLARIVRNNSSTEIYPLSKDRVKFISSTLSNKNNPHILGIDAKEIFFLQDNVILVEGQDDVIYYKKILSDLGIVLKGSFFGWGIGGAQNLKHILSIFNDLGYERISVLFDNNVEKDVQELSDLFKNYQFQVIPTDDVRDKPEVKARPAMSGLYDTEKKKLKDEYIADMIQIITQINQYYDK